MILQMTRIVCRGGHLVPTERVIGSDIRGGFVTRYDLDANGQRTGPEQRLEGPLNRVVNRCTGRDVSPLDGRDYFEALLTHCGTSYFWTAIKETKSHA